MNTHSFSSIAGSKPVTAFKDLWIVGDSFVNDIYYVLPAINSKAKAEDIQGPFIYDQFNVRCFTSNPVNTKPVMVKLVNCLIKALNELEKLPKIIAVIPDWDILKDIDYCSYGVVEMITKVLQWIIREMSRAVKSKIDRLKQLKPGAVEENEPKIIWVRMINRLSSYDQTLTIRRKFNNVLENLLAREKNTYLMDLHPAVNNAALFSKPNSLNEEGTFAYWKEFDECIKLFEDNKLLLIPEIDGFKSNSSNNQSAILRKFKLPPPPPTNDSKRRDQSKHRSTEYHRRGRYDHRYDRNNNHHNINPSRRFDNGSTRNIYFNRNFFR